MKRIQWLGCLWVCIAIAMLTVGMLISLQYVGDILDSELRGIILSNGGVPMLVCLIGYLVTEIFIEGTYSERNTRFCLEDDVE